jgi:predicted metal-dependent hydrolase
MKSSASSGTHARGITKEQFKAEVAEWTEWIGARPKELHVRLMKHKWGSCSTTGRVTFNLELLFQSDAVRREAIVEELLHLKVPNHGKLFKALKRAYLARAGVS